MSEWNEAIDAARGAIECETDPQKIDAVLLALKQDTTDLDRIAAYITRHSHQLYVDEDEGQWQASTGWSVVGSGRTMQEALHNLAVMLPEV